MFSEGGLFRSGSLVRDLRVLGPRESGFGCIEGFERCRGYETVGRFAGFSGADFILTLSRLTHGRWAFFFFTQ